MEPATLSRTLTIRQAADETNLSTKALQGRLERGSLPHVKHNGIRRIPRSALIEAGLLGADGTTPEGEPPRQGTPESTAVVGELLAQIERQAERLERMAGELGQQKAITKHAESFGESEKQLADELQAEVVELRSKVMTLEQQAERRPRRDPLLRRRWLRRR